MFSIGAIRDCGLSSRSRRVPGLKYPLGLQVLVATRRGLPGIRHRLQNVEHPRKEYWGEGAL